MHFFLNPFLLTKTWEICYDGSWNQIKSNEVNVDENQETAAKYEVMSIPTLIVFKDGEPVDKVVGFQPKEQLEQVLAKHY